MGAHIQNKEMRSFQTLHCGFNSFAEVCLLFCFKSRNRKTIYLYRHNVIYLFEIENEYTHCVSMILKIFEVCHFFCVSFCFFHIFSAHSILLPHLFHCVPFHFSLLYIVFFFSFNRCRCR